MTGIVDSIKEGVGENVKKFGKQNLRDNISTGRKNLKGFISEAQAADPGSKYLGTSIMPGVKSEKEVQKDKKNIRTASAAEAAAAEAEKNKPKPMPLSSLSETAASKRRAARRSGGRIDTILSDTLG